MSVNYNGVEYFYTTDLQGDVTGIVDGSGNTVVTYAYTAWGEAQWSDGTTNETLKTTNPLRYRGYVYDQETGLYYLKSRYYDPYLCRFINGDGFAATGQGFIGNNMFAYCGNNPVMNYDPHGYAADWLINICEKIKSKLFIRDQHHDTIGNKSFGLSTVSKAGCPAVSTYNALIGLGDFTSFDDVLTYYNDRVFLLDCFGLLGASPSHVARCFLDRGYNVAVTDNPAEINARSQVADACIMYYMYYIDGKIFPRAHFEYYCRIDDGTHSSAVYMAYNTDSRTGCRGFTDPYSYGNKGKRYGTICIFIY